MTGTDDRALLLRLIEDAGEGISTAELEEIVTWIETTGLSAMMLDLWEEGKLTLRWRDGEPLFRSK